MCARPRISLLIFARSERNIFNTDIVNQYKVVSKIGEFSLIIYYDNLKGCKFAADMIRTD